MTDSASQDVTLFGIRHHGPGSARSLRRALETLRPDIVLIEGPPDAAGVLPLLAHPEMRPPVAVLVYQPDDPRQAVFYPYTVFSPEWQAADYALRRQIPVRFIDLPQANAMALIPPEPVQPDNAASAPEDVEAKPPVEEPAEYETAGSTASPVYADPLGWMARAAGFTDGERWWEHLVEQRVDATGLFAGLLEAMTSLRQAVEAEAVAANPANASAALEHGSPAHLQALREASMRQAVRGARREGYTRIAVVCGAWHTPALAAPVSARNDTALLKGLARVKTEATWVPWSNERLSAASGYGAGIHSPGWYQHLWDCPDQPVVRWMARVARLLRDEDLDASSAHVIEAVRLAEALAALRDRPAVALEDLNEASRAVFCLGSDLPMRLIARKLIVGEAVGQVPVVTPTVPLQQDFQRLQKRLRLPLSTPADKPLQLDLRGETDQERSLLLYRLNLLDIPWGKPARANGKGTFKEHWHLDWQPELSVSLIEAARWGSTVVDAATASARSQAEHARALPDLTRLVEAVLLADLPEATPMIVQRLQALSALTADVADLMDALPPLVRVLRYGSVRKTSTGPVAQVLEGLVTRICIGLPPASFGLDDDAASEMLGRLNAVQQALNLLQNQDYQFSWRAALRTLAGADNGGRGSLAAAPLLAGRASRILLDEGADPRKDAETRMSLALSRAVHPHEAAAWLEGFLSGSGLLLLHDDALWSLLDEWLQGVSGDTFTMLLPLLRRTFATFAPPERRQLGERAARGKRAALAAEAGFDTARADAVLPLVMRLLGIANNEDTQ